MLNKKRRPKQTWKKQVENMTKNGLMKEDACD